MGPGRDGSALDKPGPFVNHPGVGLRGVDDDGHDRSRIAALLGYGEFFLDAAVVVTLSVGGVVLFSVVVYDFVRHLGQGPVLRQVLDIAILAGAVLVLGVTVLLLRLGRTGAADPRPSETD